VQPALADLALTKTVDLPNASVGQDITATVNAVPSTNTATITHADQFDPNLVNNTASAGVT
jgi:hypothetical protein